MNGMHIDEFDLTQIRLLAELCRSRSVSQAAQRIGVSQSAASHALAKMRKQLRDPLFTRTRDGFSADPLWRASRQRIMRGAGHVACRPLVE
jgi:DNA-binding transcriptional LysR family regulator